MTSVVLVLEHLDNIELVVVLVHIAAHEIGRVYFGAITVHLILMIGRHMRIYLLRFLLGSAVLRVRIGRLRVSLDFGFYGGLSLPDLLGLGFGL